MDPQANCYQIHEQKNTRHHRSLVKMEVAVPEEPQKKIFRARKTMKMSDRQQLEALHNTLSSTSPSSSSPTQTPLVNGIHSEKDKEKTTSPSPKNGPEKKRDEKAKDVKGEGEIKEDEKSEVVKVDDKEADKSEHSSSSTTPIKKGDPNKSETEKMSGEEMGAMDVDDALVTTASFGDGSEEKKDTSSKSFNSSLSASPSSGIDCDPEVKEGFLCLSEEDDVQAEKDEKNDQNEDKMNVDVEKEEDKDEKGTSEKTADDSPSAGTKRSLSEEEDDKEIKKERDGKRARLDGEELEAQLELKITATGGSRHKLEKMVQQLVEERLRVLQLTVFDRSIKELKERVEKIDSASKQQNALQHINTLQAKISRLAKKFGAANQASENAKRTQEVFSASAVAQATNAANITPNALQRPKTCRTGRRRSAQMCEPVDTDNSDGDTSDTSWGDSWPRSHSPIRANEGGTQEQVRDQTCEADSCDQIIASVSHPTEIEIEVEVEPDPEPELEVEPDPEPEPISYDWQEMNWQPTNLPFNENPEPHEWQEMNWQPTNLPFNENPEHHEWQEMNWQPTNFPFNENPGPVGEAAALNSEEPKDFIELFISDVLIQNIVDQTNLYAGQCIQDTDATSQHSRIHSWKPVTVSEMKTFLGLFFLTGIIHKPELDMYWCADEMLATPYFSKVMPRNRFEIIWRFLHFNDTTARAANDTDMLYEVRPVLDHLVSKFRELYQPNTNISIDEGMLLWRKRLPIGGKNPAKSGMKSYNLRDSETGYCFNLKPYCGESSTLGDTVVSLLDRLAGHGYRLFMDNFDNFVPLSERLLDLKTQVCDATFQENYMKVVDEWQRGYQETFAKQKPACIMDFNNAVNGVEGLDEKIGYYPFVRRSQEWTKKFVTYLFQISLFNAFVIYKAKNPQGNCKTLLSFIKSVVKSWTSPEQTGGVEERGTNFFVPPTDNIITPRAPYNLDPRNRVHEIFALHALVPIVSGSNKKRTTRRCRVCARKGLRRESSFYCKGCCVPLHSGDCYTAYHSKVDYSV
ncbi:activating transcription factor 7-interacting protein 1 isoform X4 [Misgurnus anguillicaudatus]|uniref:activating transcription factor 7-interacting protein 1 isoform X4 n=1 Tax=Misgurnus anguillicaudatus TaxID=75329 RepID=UPI003CCF29DE